MLLPGCGAAHRARRLNLALQKMRCLLFVDDTGTLGPQFGGDMGKFYE